MATVNGKRLSTLSNQDLYDLMNQTEQNDVIETLQREMVRRGLLNESVLGPLPNEESKYILDDPLAAEPSPPPSPPRSPSPPPEPPVEEEAAGENWSAFSIEDLNELLTDPELNEDSRYQIQLELQLRGPPEEPEEEEEDIQATVTELQKLLAKYEASNDVPPETIYQVKKMLHNYGVPVELGPDPTAVSDYESEEEEEEEEEEEDNNNDNEPSSTETNTEDVYFNNSDEDDDKNDDESESEEDEPDENENENEEPEDEDESISNAAQPAISRSPPVPAPVVSAPVVPAPIHEEVENEAPVNWSQFSTEELQEFLEDPELDPSNQTLIRNLLDSRVPAPLAPVSVPSPVPSPVSVPAPSPVPSPVSVPAPSPVSVPTPSPVPVPVPVPAPAPAQEEVVIVEEPEEADVIPAPIPSAAAVGSPSQFSYIAEGKEEAVLSPPPIAPVSVAVTKTFPKELAESTKASKAAIASTSPSKPFIKPSIRIRRPVTAKEEKDTNELQETEAKEPQEPQEPQESDQKINDTQYMGLSKEELIELWENEVDFQKRDRIIRVMIQKNIFPSKDITAWERQAGLYPDTIDPEFLQKLLLKREFAESLQTTWKPQVSDPCKETTTFEVTPVQRFVSNWMSPKTPYLSALLFHGVGVGKTCAAIQISEAWLEQYPSKQVIIVCPPTIKQGFLRTIFDPTKVIIGEDNEPNTASQCTGDVYMKLTNMLYERDLEKIRRAVTRMINRRYKIFGYVAFANYISSIEAKIPSSLSEERQEELRKKAIRTEFSHRLLLVDEAHNLRDVVDEGKGADEFAGGKEEEDDMAGGKLLTPYLRRVLQGAEGLKFCALTATPMYNSYREIIFLVNLLLMNDKKATIRESDIFDREGNIIEEGAERLGRIAQTYISFMRGENPLSFPIRLFSDDITILPNYPTYHPRGSVIDEEERKYYFKLPLVPVALQGATLAASEVFTEALPQSESGVGLSTMALAKLVQAGNIVFPETAATKGNSVEAYTKRTSGDAIKTVFTKDMIGGKAQYRAKEISAEWLSVGHLAEYSPKFDFLLRYLQGTEGCVFIYTRFISGGALPLALALEANGYTLYGRKSNEGLLADGIQVEGGRQCALCPRKEQNHAGMSHTFRPAYYGLLTGDVTLSPRNDLTIQAQRVTENVDGSQMKIIIGSQIASEGVDLKYIRETHVLDSWFHLNKTEQILGRAIRYLSHCALPPEKRNNTVFLYACYFPENSDYADTETADLYSYRLGFKKAVTIGRVTRLLKQSAIDCNLNHDAIVISDEDAVRQIDSRRTVREEVNINDMPFTAVCDWIETCDYTCSPKIDIVGQKNEIDDSTYDEFSARWRMEKIRSVIRSLFDRQPFYSTEDIWNMFSNVPRFVMIDLLNSIVGNKTFQIEYDGKKGYIRYCNGYYMFQPNVYFDVTIPLSIRVGRFPVKRDMYYPMEYDIPELDEQKHIPDTLGTVEEFWRAAKEWVNQLSRWSHGVILPNEIQQRRIVVSQGNKELEAKYEQTLEMILWFHQSFHESGRVAEDRDGFRRTLLFHFWDEWLRLDEQLFLIYSSDMKMDLSIQECIRENEYRIGRLLVRRFYQPESDGIAYLCEEGTECQSSIIESVQKDTHDRMNSFTVTPQTTGSLYGFLITKNGDLTFKTGIPAPDGKIDRGQECGIVSNMTGHISKLISLGVLFEQSGRGNMGLNRATLLSDENRRIRGTVRVCVLMNLVLRYMDALHFRNRVWFFRPLFSRLAGHVGLFRRGKR